MGNVLTKDIRNICLMGHGGSGKTSVAEAMLYISKTIFRLGNPTDGNTVCDYDAEETKRGFSISLSLANFMWKDCKVNLIDAPGFLDFEGEVKAGARAADAALIVVDAKSGVQVGTELAWENATAAGLPKAFFINKFDDPEARYQKVLDALIDNFGKTICPIIIPRVEGDKVTGFINLIEKNAYVYDSKTGDRTVSEIPAGYEDVVEKYRDKLLEAVATSTPDEEVTMKYFEGEEITVEEINDAIHEGIIHGTLTPVFCGSATKLWGLQTLLDVISHSFPRHTAKKVEKDVDGNDVAIDKDNGDCALFVFKTIADPFVGKMSLFKVMNGTLSREMTLKNIESGAQEKLSHIYTLNGKMQAEVDVLHCGDIGMIAKLSGTNTNDTLTTGDVRYKKIDFPKPPMTKAVRPAAKGDEDKLSASITKLLDEDKTLSYLNNAETKQQLISGMGEMHIDTIISRMKSRYGTSVILEEPKIAYRETIKKTVQSEGKHKKQSGGAGQFGHVKITFSRGEDPGLTFTQSVVGGSVPKGYYPAVEKGLLEAMQKGVLAGYPVVNLAADLFDGSYHPVDSNEISFKLAAILAYKDALPKAQPVLLEPVGKLYVTVPESLVGDVMGDLNKRRGRVLGMEPSATRQGYTVVEADVPQSEMSDYVIVLRAMTQGRGSYDFDIQTYEEVPGNIAQKVIEEAKKDQE